MPLGVDTNFYDRRMETRSTEPIVRFEFNGAIHTALDWSSRGFRTKTPAEFKHVIGESVVIRGIGISNQDIVPVLIRAEIRKLEDNCLSFEFLQARKRDRIAFERFVNRSIEKEQKRA